MTIATDTALVLETNNLTGGAAARETVVATLERLLVRLTRQTVPLASLAQRIVTHDGLDGAAQQRLEAAAGAPLTFVALPAGTGYYEAKNRGFDATDAAVVVFADSDCWPEDRWLASLLAPLADPDVGAVAGRTLYRPARSGRESLWGIAATTIDFMDFPNPDDPRATLNFYANNVAFRRAVFGPRRFPALELYRGACQSLGMTLRQDGVALRFAPEARTVHRLPDTVLDFVRLRFLRGADLARLAPSLVEAYAPAPLRALGAAVPPLGATAVLGARFGFSLRALNHQGAPPLDGVPTALAAAAITGISALDAAGAVLGSLGGRLGARDGRGGERVLRYHRDRDGLDRAATR